MTSGSTHSLPTWIRRTYSVVVVGLALLCCWYLAAAFADPMGTCNDATPWFEGFVTDSAVREWFPPDISCRWHDTDLPQLGQRHEGPGTDLGWFTPIVVLLALVDVALGLRRFGRTARSDSQSSDNEVRPSSPIARRRGD